MNMRLCKSIRSGPSGLFGRMPRPLPERSPPDENRVESTLYNPYSLRQVRLHPLKHSSPDAAAEQGLLFPSVRLTPAPVSSSKDPKGIEAIPRASSWHNGVSRKTCSASAEVIPSTDYRILAARRLAGLSAYAGRSGVVYGFPRARVRRFRPDCRQPPQTWQDRPEPEQPARVLRNEGWAAPVRSRFRRSCVTRKGGDAVDHKKHDIGPSGGYVLGDGPVPIRLSRDSFRRFDQWMDQQLAALVAKWAHAAAPNASKSRPTFRRRKLRRRKPR